MARQLYYGYLSDTIFEESGSNGFIRFTGDFTSGSNVITNVSIVGGYFNWDTLRVGQTIVASGPLTAGSTISSFNEIAQTITIAANAATTTTGTTIRISPASGQYYISSSIYDPQSLIRPNNITGSQDSNYISDEPTYTILGPAKPSSGGSVIPGRFHKYTVTEVLSRNQSSNNLSFYVEWGEKGTEANSGDILSTTDGVNIAISAQTSFNSLPTMFSRNVGLMGQVSAGSDFAAYQIEVQDFLDDLTQTDIYYTGSLVSKNNGGINFTGSGVNVTVSGSDGVFVDITGGNPFPYTGSAIISGSLEITGSLSITPLPIQDLINVVTYNVTTGTLGYINATSGTSGLAGSSGTTGQSGTSGTNGANGQSGESGTNGSSGLSGESGSTGSSGLSGESGSTGSSGPFR
jgi:hypothetical protein